MLWIAEAAGREVFGYYGDIRFGISTIIACSLFAALTFSLIERPVEILRRKLKRSRNETVPVAAGAASSVGSAFIAEAAPLGKMAGAERKTA